MHQLRRRKYGKQSRMRALIEALRKTMKAYNYGVQHSHYHEFWVLHAKSMSFVNFKLSQVFLDD